jgi:hypothetical protein
MLFMGVYPRVFLDRSRGSVEALRQQVQERQAGGLVTSAGQHK